MRARVLTLVLLCALAASCGGGQGPSTPPSSPSPPKNPCDQVPMALAPAALAPESGRASKMTGGEIDTRVSALEALWTHRAAVARRGLGPLAPAQAQDAGEISVLRDSGDLILPANRLDLAAKGLRFSRNVSGGYDVTPIDATFHEPLGARLTLSDDDSAEQAIRFSFPFFDRAYQVAFVNSDGNLTFGEGDDASTERNVARLLSGPPRVAPFLADLDPSAGGAVLVQSDATAFTVTWCDVPGFEVPEQTTFQATLMADGSLEVRYGPTISLDEAVVGVSPGRTEAFTPVDLSGAGPIAGGSAAVGERFAGRPGTDNVAITQAFYAAHGDLYDQLVVWTDTSYVRQSFAYETTIANDVQGLGIDLFDFTGEFGSAGRLRSVVMMDALIKYPDDPAQKFLGENTTLSLVGQEVGHRWLVFFNFLDHNREPSDALLGRDRAHWGFFVDSDASVMEGNDIEDLGGGSFRTVAAVQRYCLLDQYAMGLVGENQVPPIFYVANPVNVQPDRTRDSAPRVGVTFNGTRRDVLIQDIVAVHGPRVPSAAESPKVHRQAFIYVVSAGRTLDQAQVAKVDRIRLAWEAFFQRATDGRMRAETRLGGTD